MSAGTRVTMAATGLAFTLTLVLVAAATGSPRVDTIAAAFAGGVTAAMAFLGWCGIVEDRAAAQRIAARHRGNRLAIPAMREATSEAPAATPNGVVQTDGQLARPPLTHPE